jgi:hypothetical protein
MILKAHSQNAGKSADEAMTEYLVIVKEWPFYGTTFFPPCKSINNKKLPAKVVIGVNAEGIVVLKKDKVKNRIRGRETATSTLTSPTYPIRNASLLIRSRKFVHGHRHRRRSLSSSAHKLSRKNIRSKHGR